MTSVSVMGQEAALAQVLPTSEDPFHGQHKSLEKISVVNTSTGAEIVPNTVPVKLDNECFSGQVMLLIKTPDVDSSKEAKPTGPTALRVSKYMKGYKRRFEFQFQIKLKKIPQGPLFLGCEVEDMIKMNRFTKGLANFLLAMIRRINPGFHYNWKTNKNSLHPKDLNEGNYEATHLSFPVEASMDRIVATKPGETPPELGYEIFESNASVKRRKRMGAGSVDWNLEDTYTLCLWSAYFDWIKWKAMNVPGCRPFSLAACVGKQPVYLSVYELPNVSAQEYKKKKPPHKRKDIRVYTRLEFTNNDHTEGGISPRFSMKSKSSSATLDTDTEQSSESEIDNKF